MSPSINERAAISSGLDDLYKQLKELEAMDDRIYLKIQSIHFKEMIVQKDARDAILRIERGMLDHSRKSVSKIEQAIVLKTYRPPAKNGHLERQR